MSIVEFVYNYRIHEIIKCNSVVNNKYFIFNSYCTIPFHNLLKRYCFTKNAELLLFIIVKKNVLKIETSNHTLKDIRWASQYRLKFNISAHPEGPGPGPLLAVKPFFLS